MGDTWWPTADGGVEYFQHTDERAPFRWSPFRCNELMHDRPWSVIEEFYDQIAAGKASVEDLRPLEQNPVLDAYGASDQKEDSDESSALGLGDGLIGHKESGQGQSLEDSTASDSKQGKDSDGYGASVQEEQSDNESDLDTQSRQSKAPDRPSSFAEEESSDDQPVSKREKNTDIEGPLEERKPSDAYISGKTGALGASEAVAGAPKPKAERRTFKFELSYSGRHFWGWQKQTGHETVQDLVERALHTLIEKRPSQNGTEPEAAQPKLPVGTAAVRVAGRTDRGVSAAGQVVSWYTWNPEINCQQIAGAINHEAPGRLRAVQVSQVSRSFHAQFSAQWRRYVYLLPLKGGELQADGRLRMQPPGEAAPHQPRGTKTTIPPATFDVRLLDGMLRRLEGRSISYGSFARDTRADRSSGQHVVCHLFRARADVVTVTSGVPRLPVPHHALRFLLVGNRFLHRMVRVVVATAIREAAAGSPENTLLRLASLECRRATAPPAPPEGLTLASVGYESFLC